MERHEAGGLRAGMEVSRVMQGRWKLPALVACMLPAWGCGGYGGGGGGYDELEPFETPPAEEVTLAVENRNFSDATLYALSEGGHRLRLGTVPGNGADTFRFRWQYGDIRIEIKLLAGGKQVTQSMLVDRGDELELVVQATLDHMIRVRRPA